MLSRMRQIWLLVLLIAATPLQSMPISQAAPWDSDWDESRQWPWPMATSYPNDDFVDNGSPLPKTSAVGEMASEYEDSNFPTLNRRWRIWQRQNLKKLQLEQMYQSPASTRVKLKRTPIQWPPQNLENVPEPGQPRYAYAYVWPSQLRTLKRKQLDPKRLRYRPSISAGVMTNLGDFFNRLEENVRFAEQSQLNEADSQLLEGSHPHQQDPDPTAQQAEEPESPNSKLLQAVRMAYRPSQKIRSLVSRNPKGYRGSQFIDPSYMWLGLGK
ncbi:uncharacterized protein [Drosophila tropicalis]|uniref:uncharacterized protein n=1 Tax=Drosophila tropicalis TaxID=46794 RepID=UPI0035AB6E03